MTTTKPLTWHRAEAGGQYADSPTEALRYYVERNGATWDLLAWPTVVVAGVRVVKPGTNACLADRWHPTMNVAKNVAQAYDVEPERVDGQATNRLTRATTKGYAL